MSRRGVERDAEIDGVGGNSHRDLVEDAAGIEVRDTDVIDADLAHLVVVGHRDLLGKLQGETLGNTVRKKQLHAPEVLSTPRGLDLIEGAGDTLQKLFFIKSGIVLAKLATMAAL